LFLTIPSVEKLRYASQATGAKRPVAKTTDGDMALFDRDEATELRELFAGMDDADEAAAREAMAEAAELLREHDFSFRHIVQETDARGLLLPTKVGAAMRLMDSTALPEAESAFSGARRLMKNCGLTFSGIISALDRQPVRAEDIQELRLAYKIEVERSRELEAELQKLRASAAAVAAAAAAAAGPAPAKGAPQPAASPFRNFVMVATLLLGVVLAASIVSTFTDTHRFASATATGSMSSALIPTAASAIMQRDSADRLSPARAGWNCWRNRSTQGPCF
jgi:hypothetical protein